MTKWTNNFQFNFLSKIDKENRLLSYFLSKKENGGYLHLYVLNQSNKHVNKQLLYTQSS